MNDRTWRKVICVLLVSSLVGGQPLVVPWMSRARAQTPKDATTQDDSMPWLKDVRAEVKARYERCQSEPIRRSYKFSVEVGRMGYVLRSNLALQLELILAIRARDLVDPTTKKLNPDALYFYERSLETVILSFSWSDRPWSNVPKEDITSAANALKDHLKGLRDAVEATDPDFGQTIGPILDQLGPISQGVKQAITEKTRDEIDKLRTASFGTPAELAEALGKVGVSTTEQEIKDWIGLGKQVEEAAKLFSKKKPTDQEIKQYQAALDRYLKSPAAGKILSKAGVKDAPKVQAAASQIAAVVLDGATLVSQWDNLEDIQKIQGVAKLLVSAGLAIQVFMTAATAGIKGGILLAVMAVLQFVDLGISLFPGGGDKKPGGGDGGKPGPDDPKPGPDDAKPEKHADDKAGNEQPEAKGGQSKTKEEEKTTKKAKPGSTSLNDERKEAKKSYNEDHKDSENQLGDASNKPIDFGKKLKEAGIDPAKEPEKAANELNRLVNVMGRTTLSNVPIGIETRAEEIRKKTSPPPLPTDSRGPGGRTPETPPKP